MSILYIHPFDKMYILSSSTSELVVTSPGLPQPEIYFQDGQTALGTAVSKQSMYYSPLQAKERAQAMGFTVAPYAGPWIQDFPSELDGPDDM